MSGGDTPLMFISQFVFLLSFFVIFPAEMVFTVSQEEKSLMRIIGRRRTNIDQIEHDKRG